MTRKDKIGVAILVVVFLFFAVALYLALPRAEGPARNPGESVFVQQRMKNLENSR